MDGCQGSSDSRAGSSVRSLFFSCGVASQSELEGVTFRAAVAGEKVLQRRLQVVQKLLPALGWNPDLAGDPDRRQFGPCAIEVRNVCLYFLHEVEQVAEAQLVLYLPHADAADEPQGQPVRAGGRLVDPFVDAPNFAFDLVNRIAMRALREGGELADLFAAGHPTAAADQHALTDAHLAVSIPALTAPRACAFAK